MSTTLIISVGTQSLYVKLESGCRKIHLVDSLGKPGNLSIKGFLAFGIAYGIAALSCTLSIFWPLWGVLWPPKVLPRDYFNLSVML